MQVILRGNYVVFNIIAFKSEKSKTLVDKNKQYNEFT